MYGGGMFGDRGAPRGPFNPRGNPPRNAYSGATNPYSNPESPGLGGQVQNLISGAGIPTAQQRYDAQAPYIQNQVSQDARAQARSLAMRGLGSSGFQAGAVNNSYADQAQQLGQLRLASEQGYNRDRQQALAFGEQTQRDMEERAQRMKMLELQKQMLAAQRRQGQMAAYSSISPAAALWAPFGFALADKVGTSILGSNPVDSVYGGM